uniref:Uncharacterized protein n=1 Tax=Magallana gigas TaxID=29159 RepID=A0A8W8LSM2_MAGGI
MAERDTDSEDYYSYEDDFEEESETDEEESEDENLELSHRNKTELYNKFGFVTFSSVTQDDDGHIVTNSLPRKTKVIKTIATENDDGSLGSITPYKVEKRDEPGRRRC